jgi:ABC-2 type transport system permease protein
VTAMTGPATTSGATSRTASPARRVLRQARFEAGTLLRNGEQLLVSVVLPVGALVALALTQSPSLGAGRRIDIAVPGVLALCVVSAAFTSQAIATGFDRRASVLRLLGTTPLGRDGLLAAKVVATLVLELIQWVLVAAVGLALGWYPAAAGLGYAVLFLLLGTWAFVALALLLAGVLRAEGVLAVANLVWVLLLVVGGVVVPRAELPAALSPVVGLLPSSALGDGLRTALGSGGLALQGVLVLLVWAVGATVLASRTFRWSD